MIKKYKSFREDLILEKAINESTVYYSPNLRDRLIMIGDEVSKSLLSIEGENIKPDVTLIDNFDDKEGHISFTTKKSAVDKIEKEIGVNYNVSFDTWSERKADEFYIQNIGNIYSSGRNHFKISKFINRVFPNKFTQKEVENFINKFKARIKSTEQEFKIVKGGDIYKWYDRDSHIIKDEVSSLGKSCMVDMQPNTFDMYAQNPDKCQLLILTENDKLVARALIFNVDEVKDKDGNVIDGIKTYMDRQYYFIDSDGIKLVNYAKDKGWAYRTSNTEGNYETITHKGKTFGAEMMISLPGEYEKYPYMDTFCYYDKDREELYNYENGDILILKDTQGGFEDPNELSVWSEYHGTSISDFDAVELANGGYVKRDDPNVIFIPNHGWYLRSDSDIVETYDGNLTHYEETVYSEMSNYFIDLGEEVRIVTNLEDEDETYLHKDDEKEFKYYDDIENLEDIKSKYPDIDWDSYVGISVQVL
jgi:hypothetical protein